VAPAEVKASGFMAFPEDAPVQEPLATPAPAAGFADEAMAVIPAELNQPVPVADPVDDHVSLAKSLSVGAWVELMSKGTWQRTQLSWISPHGTMYLFTSVQGKTQSMTLRMLERMLTQSTLRVVSVQQNMMDDALDAVVHAAMLNSLDIKL
jgi:hypothetical protein